MDHLKELSPGTIWPHLLEAIERDVIEDIRMYAQGRAKDVTRGAETPELAALLVDKYCEGMASALRIAGLDSVVRAEGDRLVREIDPQFEAHLEARRPSGVAELYRTAPVKTRHRRRYRGAVRCASSIPIAHCYEMVDAIFQGKPRCGNSKIGCSSSKARYDQRGEPFSVHLHPRRRSRRPAGPG